MAMDKNKDKSDFTINVNSPGNFIANEITFEAPVYFNGQGNNLSVPPNYTDEEIALALTNIIGKGKAIDAKWKWAGAHWLLHFACNFPLKAQEFCNRVDLLPLPDDLEFKCDYNNIRPYSTLSFFGEDARQLDKVRCSANDRGAFLLLRPVVKALQEELVRVHQETGFSKSLANP